MRFVHSHNKISQQESSKWKWQIWTSKNVIILLTEYNHKMIWKKTKWFVISDRLSPLLVESHLDWNFQIISSSLSLKTLEWSLKYAIFQHLGSLVDENLNRVINLIYQKIEQATLYKIWYTTIHPNSAGACYWGTKFA